jgi:DUF4097 and DUF4098 domain-containing protein YvlB
MRAATLIAGGFFACGLFAQTGQLRREGGYWVEVVQGTTPSSAAQFTVHTRGPVTLDGLPNASGASYVLTKRVRASSAAEARRLLAELQLQPAPGALILAYPPRPLAQAELHVTVPSRVGRVLIETHSGDISVEDIRGAVEVKSGAGVIQMDRIGSFAVARTAGGDIRLGRIDGGVRCYSGGGTISIDSAGGESWFDTAGGEIRIGRSAGPVHASTAGGNIQIGRAEASVAARTAGGRIEVAEAHDIVVAANSGGSIQVGAARGVRLEATGGSIRLRGSSGALRAVSDVGNILAELIPGNALKDSILSTGAGDITVYLPSDIAVTIQALNEGGRTSRIVSEFAEIPVRSSRGESHARVFAEGDLNGGGPTLRLTSSEGTIYLRRTRQ